MNEEPIEAIHPIDQCLIAWFDAIPDDVYEKCPCGCSIKFRFVMKDEKILAEHESRFIENYKKENGL
jgi:hypothetical protein